MKPIVEVREHALVVRNFLVYRLDYHCQQIWVLETKILVLHFALDKGEQLLEMVLSLVDFWIVTLHFIEGARFVWLLIDRKPSLVVLEQALLHLGQCIRLVYVHTVEVVASCLVVRYATLRTVGIGRLQHHLVLVELLDAELLDCWTVDTHDDVGRLTHT